jgi:putative ABC transport system permease protein
MTFLLDLKYALRSLARAKGVAPLAGVLSEGVVMAVIGVAAGVLGGFALPRIVGSYLQNVELPGALPAIGAAMVLLAAAVVASVPPAARAARVDVVQALRGD